VPPFGGLRGNVHGSSMARWKARGRLLIGDNWTFFASYHGWGTMSRYLSKLRCLKRGWVTLNKNFRGKGRPPPTSFGIRKLESLCYRMVKKIAENFNRLSRVHQRPRQTDRRQTTTNGSAIAYSEREREFTSAKNYTLCVCVVYNHVDTRQSRHVWVFLLVYRVICRNVVIFFLNNLLRKESQNVDWVHYESRLQEVLDDIIYLRAQR